MQYTLFKVKSVIKKYKSYWNIDTEYIKLLSNNELYEL